VIIFLLLTAVFATLAFFAAGFLPGVAAASAAVLSAACCLTADRRRLPVLVAGPALCLAALIMLTALPLPRGTAGLPGSPRAAQDERVREAVRTAAELDLGKPFRPLFSLTRNRAATLRTALMLVAALAAASLAARLPAAWKRRYLGALVAMGAGLAAAGYVTQWVLPQGKTIWWLFPVQHGRPVACFVNRNHFGGLLAMLCPSAVLLCLDSLSRRRAPAALAWGGAFVIMSLAAILSLSRGAWLAYAVSSAVVGILVLRRQPLLRAAAVLLLAGGVAWGLLRLPQGGALEERFETLGDGTRMSSAQMRLHTWRDGLRILGDYPIAGCGAGAFRMVFPQYRSATTRKFFYHAENEYVQIPAEVGLAGSLAAALLVFGVARAWLANRREGRLDPVLSLAVAGALTVVLVHAVFDFALRIPLYTFTFASLLGLVLDPGPAGRAAAGPGRLRIPLAPAVAVAFAVLCLFFSRAIHQNDRYPDLERAGADRLCRALVWSPTSWQIWYNLGREALSGTGTRRERFGASCLDSATRYDPNNYRLWIQVAVARRARGDFAGARKAARRVKELRPWARVPEVK